MYKLKYLAPVVLLLTIVTPAFAVDSSPRPSTSPLERRGEIRQEVKQEIKTEKQELKSEIKTKLEEFRSSVAELHANRLEKRFNAYYSRLSNIGSRLQARLTILKTSGKDTTSAQAKLTTALTTLGLAKTKGAEAVAAFRAIDPAKFPEQKDKAFAARDIAETARKLFKQATDELKLATKEVKALGKPAPSASN
jgi:vacuolar-type H+-ATPase subunit I/STV1